MEEQMRIIGRKISICMAIVMSLGLSLTGTLTSGHFTIVGFLLSFLVSTIISLIIGFIIPIGKVTGAAAAALKLERGSLPERCLSSLISDVIYTPIMTLVMVFLAYTMAMKSSGGMAQLNFVGMFLSSLIICFIVAFVLIFIFQPLFMKIFMKNGGARK